MKTRWLVLLMLVVSSCQGQNRADKPIKLETQMDKVSYAIGLDIGRGFKDQTMEINADALVQGIRDALAGGAALMTPEEVKITMETWEEEMMNKMDPNRQGDAEKNQAEGETFLQENQTKPGVVTLPSGLQYKVLKEGNGRSPKPQDEVVTHYQGRLINGKVFDSSYDRGEPISFPVNGVIAGWTEALQLMKEGDKWELYIPSKLAYGSRGAGPDIGPNATLIFEVELLKVK